MKHDNILILVCFLFLFSACKKNEPYSPMGANVMLAKVDGKSWSRKPCWECFGGGRGMRVSYEDRDFFVLEGQDPDRGMSIELVIYSMPGVGVYPLNTNYSRDNNNVNRASVYDSKLGIYTTSSKNTGEINITTVDLKKKIISGTFTFTAGEERDLDNTIKVTNGFFDIAFL
jgi:hypothetical protein